MRPDASPYTIPTDDDPDAQRFWYGNVVRVCAGFHWLAEPEELESGETRWQGVGHPAGVLVVRRCLWVADSGTWVYDLRQRYTKCMVHAVPGAHLMPVV